MKKLDMIYESFLLQDGTKIPVDDVVAVEEKMET